jgi:hypothetical protein
MNAAPIPISSALTGLESSPVKRIGGHTPSSNTTGGYLGSSLHHLISFNTLVVVMNPHDDEQIAVVARGLLRLFRFTEGEFKLVNLDLPFTESVRFILNQR